MTTFLPSGAAQAGGREDRPAPDAPAGITMRVRKRNGSFEPVDVNKIVRAVARCCTGLGRVDPLRVATKTISGLYDGATTQELDTLSIRTAALLTAEEPEYSRLAARLLMTYVDKEVANQGIHSFSQSIAAGQHAGLVADAAAALVADNARKLNDAVDPSRNELFEYFGARTVYDRYLLRHPETREVLETPQYFYMRVAVGLSETPAEAIELYRLLSSHEYMVSSPTLFNSGTRHPQMSSCYLLDSPRDELEAIYGRYTDVALLSKFSGGIGLAYHRVRSRGSLIRGTNGRSNGIVPWLKTLDSSVAAVNQCFAPDTSVLTADGVARIEDVRPGDLVLGREGEYRQVLDRMVYAQDGPMVEIDVQHAAEPIRVTAGHPFWTIRGVPAEQAVERAREGQERGTPRPAWVEAGRLEPGDSVGQVIPQEVVPVPGLAEDDARLYGILLGGGRLCGDGREWCVCAAPSRDAALEFVRRYLARAGVRFREDRGADAADASASIRWAAGPVEAPAVPFTRSDLHDAGGRRRIARRLAHLPPAQTRALIRGLLEAGGAAGRGREIHFTSASRPLVEGLRYQLLRLGIPCAVRHRQQVEPEGEAEAFDLRIPAVAEAAALAGCAATAQPDWFVHGGCVWSRVQSRTELPPVPLVHDLKVEGTRTYMTAGSLVHNGGKRKGACCVYLETWHADIEEFLELRRNTGDEAQRTHNLNLAHWIPDLFMKRVEEDGAWSLFDPKQVPELPDLYGPEFERAYLEAEARGLQVRQLRARELYGRMMKTLAETGNGWMTFKDASNLKCNQTGRPGRTVHLSNLCTEILEVTSDDETAVCNLGSVNLARHVGADGFDFERLGRNVAVAVKYLDRVVDLNYYPTPQAAASNRRWRPVGLGLMGLQDVFFQLRLAFDAPEARALSRRIQEEIYYAALSASCELAERHGPHPGFAETRAAAGVLQFDLWAVRPEPAERWQALRRRIQAAGLRNSLLIAIAPTATIASIVGCYECIEPQVSNLFKRETLSGEFLQVNHYLVRELQARGLWTEGVRNAVKVADGGIQGIEEIPAELRAVYRTAWEIPMRALVDMAAERGPFIDQSQSLNLFMESPTIGKLSSMYLHAWKQGLKTTYYLRSRPATGIAKASLPADGAAAVACSLENPESCEACQ